jgi:hypothetical protein
MDALVQHVQFLVVEAEVEETLLEALVVPEAEALENHQV